MHTHSLSRRHFLRHSVSSTAGLALGYSLAAGREAAVKSAEAEPVIHLTDHLAVFRGPINVGIIRSGDRALLIDCGDGRVGSVLEHHNVRSVDQIVFTHHHRDQACGVHAFAKAGARIAVPASEQQYFDDVDTYWNDPKSRWHIYNFHPHHLMLTESVPVDMGLDDGHKMTWGPASIQIVSTPGHTDGSVSYVVDVDGVRAVFSGDVIYDAGQVWEIYSLQKGIRRGTRTTRDYHGFLGAKAELVESLGKIKGLKPRWLVPSHGQVMANPKTAIDELIQRLDLCYDRYVAISALRHYFPEIFEEYASRKDHMKIRAGKPVPGCLRHFGTTWMVVSEEKAAFAIDCGNPTRIGDIQNLIKSGEVRDVEGLWVTHYHDDHVDAIPRFQATFDCPCYADRHVAQVITNPTAWRLPCISPSVARVDRVTEDGESWQWRGFKMTAYHLPGQTLYHGGLLVEKEGLRMFFIGDSFTMGGIDDYCAWNRNWLGRNVGFDRCVRLIERLEPTHIFNCHVADAFDFTPQQCQCMRANLAEREELYGRLVPWEHANHGMDEPWVRCFPYEQSVRPGEEVTIRVTITNHSISAIATSCRAALPHAWPKAEKQPWSNGEVAAKSDGQLLVSLRVPPAVKPGRYVIPFDIVCGEWTLPQFTEAIVVVGLS